jgi:hypothetical protein
VNEADQAVAKATQPVPTPTRPVPQAKSDKPTAAKTPVEGSPSTDAAVRDENVAADDLTRSPGAVRSLTLKDVKKVYLDVRGEAVPSELRNNFLENFGPSGVVTGTTDADEADASLKIVISQTRAGGIEATARLVNARGAVLWPKAGTRRYSGETSKVVAEIVKDVLSEIRLARTAGTQR